MKWAGWLLVVALCSGCSLVSHRAQTYQEIATAFSRCTAEDEACLEHAYSRAVALGYDPDCIGLHSSLLLANLYRQRQLPDQQRLWEGRVVENSCSHSKETQVRLSDYLESNYLLAIRVAPAKDGTGEGVNLEVTTNKGLTGNIKSFAAGAQRQVICLPQLSLHPQYEQNVTRNPLVTAVQVQEPVEGSTEVCLELTVTSDRAPEYVKKTANGLVARFVKPAP